MPAPLIRGASVVVTMDDTRGGAEVLGRPDCGTIAPGKRADLAIWDMRGIEAAGA